MSVIIGSTVKLREFCQLSGLVGFLIEISSKEGQIKSDLPVAQGQVFAPRQLLLHCLKAPTVGALISYMTAMDTQSTRDARGAGSGGNATGL